MRVIISVPALALLSSTAMAQQSYTVFTPGQPRTVVTGNSSGGYVVFTPGQPRTVISPPDSNGNRTVFTPGQPRSFINSNN
jgi:hypothetical protein